jgi:hypothetical protein
LLGEGDKGIKIVYGEENNIVHWADYRSAKVEHKSLVPANKPNEPTKGGPLSFLLFEPPFTSVPTVRWGYPTLQSLWW